MSFEFDKKKIFSEYLVDKIAIKIGEEVIEADCIGKYSEEMDTKTVTKGCRGVTRKSKTRGTGTGKVTIELHAPRYMVNKMLNMYQSGLVQGVAAYGVPSLHPDFQMTTHVKDEDDNEMFKAYPKCNISNKPNVETENGAEDVAMISMEIAVLPDEYEMGVYEAFAEDLPTEGDLTKETWMKNFTPKIAHTTA